MPESHYLQNLTSKMHINKGFKQFLKEIKTNEKGIRKGKICPFCNVTNSGLNKTCFCCGKQI